MYSRITVKLFLFLISVTIFCSCSSTIIKGQLPEINASNGFSNARYVEGELIVRIENIHLFANEQLEKNNIIKKIPKDQKPSLKLWSSKISDQTNQKIIGGTEYSISPTEIVLEKENGNTILYWDLSDSLLEGNSIILKRKFNYMAYDYKPIIDSSIVLRKWNEIPEEIFSFYTKSENFLINSEEINLAADSIVGTENNPFVKAKLIFNWVRSTMKYIYPPEKRGANEALKKGEGDCGQYSSLFIALARSQGIPARQQSGFNFIFDKTGYHVWSEIYLPTYGWVPVDATKENGFCFIDNKRLIASVGMNIPLSNTPDYATYDNSDVQNGVTDFMQLVTIVSSGFEAKISTERKILRSEKREL